MGLCSRTTFKVSSMPNSATATFQGRRDPWGPESASGVQNQPLWSGSAQGKWGAIVRPFRVMPPQAETL